MAQVQVGLRPVLGNEHLPVLIGVHSARVNVQVGVELLEGHLQPRAFSSRPREAAAIPFPRPDTTPPVMKIYFAIPIPPLGKLEVQILTRQNPLAP